VPLAFVARIKAGVELPLGARERGWQIPFFHDVGSSIGSPASAHPFDVPPEPPHRRYSPSALVIDDQRRMKGAAQDHPRPGVEFAELAAATSDLVSNCTFVAAFSALFHMRK